MPGEAKTWLRLLHRRDRLDSLMPLLGPAGNWHKKLRLHRMIEKVNNQLRELDERLTCEGVL